MKKWMKTCISALLIGTASLALYGCGSDSQKSGAAPETLRIGVTNFADSLEPLIIILPG